jgi:hypothetical protein
MSSSDCLANTGFDLWPLMLAGLLSLLLGFVLLKSVKGRMAVLAVVLVAGSLLLSQAASKPASAACAPTTTSSAPTTSTTDPPALSPLALGASYLASQINSSGYVEGPGGADYGDTAQTLLALRATGSTASDVTSAIARAAGYFASNVDAYVDSGQTPSAANDSASALAELLLVAHATSTPSLQSQVSSLVARLEATQGLAEVGLFGASDPTYDGVIRQALVLEALFVSGVPSSNAQVQAGLTWLLAQQCTGGGFSSDVANNACSGLETNYQGPDTNSTGAALVALGELSQPSGLGSPIAQALSYLAASELSNAGWDYFGGGFDASSTAIVIEGLRAVGQDMSSTTGPWSKGGTAPMGALGSLEVLSPGSGQGGFLFQPSSGGPDVISSEQALTAFSGTNLPL